MLTALASTAVGSLPSVLAARERGIDPAVTAAMTRENFPDLPYLVELPGRGAGADMIGRTAALLAQVSSDFAVSAVPTGWRRSTGAGADLERASRWWVQDLDALAEVYHDHRTALKLQLCGPLTFSRYVEDAAGEPALRDPGFVRDVCDALGEAALAHIAHVRRLAPEAQVVMQIDEPALQDVLRGAVSTASGYSRLRAVAESDAASLLEAVVNRVGAGTERTAAAAHEVWLHDCGNRPSMRVAAHAGFDALSLDATGLTAADVEECGVLLDSGRRLVLGVLTPTDWAVPETVLRDRAIARSEWLRSRLSLDERVWASQVTLAPTCGLAGASAHEARAVLRAVSAAGRSVAGDTIALDDPGR